MRKLTAVLVLFATTAALANDQSYRSLQSGSQFGGTPLYDRGIRGEGQIIAILDTGLDYRLCYFAEANGARPPINTGTPQGGLQSSNVDLTRRKVVAYNFLYSCDQYPGANGCDDPNGPVPQNYDNQRHGTFAAGAAAGDKDTPLVHDSQDGIALGAKLIIQDAGFIGGDNCTHRPGIGCPVNLTPILDQAYRQGARIHSNSWGDAQGSPSFPPTANYSQSAWQVDDFVFKHPDMLVVFNTGNFLGQGTPPDRTLSAPGAAKNTLQVGGTRTQSRGDDTVAAFTLLGPTRDGRIKPDVVGPAWVVAADYFPNQPNFLCAVSLQPGTSWSSPTVAGAAALARQYYTDGFYPSGVATPSNKFTPSAALVKATIISSARAVPWKATTTGDLVATKPVPSNEQGFGFPVLDDALFFPGDRAKMKVVDVPLASGLAAGESTSIRLNVKSGTPLKAVLVWTDPAGTPAGTGSTTPQLVNDLDLTVNELRGNGQQDMVNNVEMVSVATPADGVYTVTVRASRLGAGPRQSYALIVTGDFTEQTQTRGRSVRRF